MPSSESQGSIRWRMPAEWEPHERCLIAWPTREELWGRHFEEAKREYAATVGAIADFEPVTLVVDPSGVEEARRYVSASVEIVEIPIDDSWVRDSGPIGVVADDGRRAGVDFRFNSWGERFLPYDKDAASAEAILAHLGLERVVSEMVLEGGSITVDGEGTLITTEQCLLNSNRNPRRTREEIERELAARLGIEKVVWLPWGHHEDEHTDGHVDGVCTYASPGVVIAQTCEDPNNPNYPLMAENLDVLRCETDAAGRPYEVVELPLLPYYDLDGDELMVSYANFYLANGAVVVPVADHPLDRDALSILESVFPDRQVVGVPGRVLSYGGGGVHCITQQIPATMEVA
ncbi:MAG: agmatine/peptidylarginine deiminase [Gaiella sp.]